MSFSKCSNLETKNGMHFKLCYQRDIGSNYIMISSKQNFRSEAFKMGFTHLKIKLIEKFKLKINLTHCR